MDPVAILGAMTKTAIDIDRVKASEAQRILGTRTLTATVDAALEFIVRRDAQLQALALARTPGVMAPLPEELPYGAAAMA